MYSNSILFYTWSLIFLPSVQQTTDDFILFAKKRCNLFNLNKKEKHNKEKKVPFWINFWFHKKIFKEIFFLFNFFLFAYPFQTKKTHNHGFFFTAPRGFV